MQGQRVDMKAQVDEWDQDTYCENYKESIKSFLKDFFYLMTPNLHTRLG